MDQEMTLAELAEASGFPGRTIRFYIARGILPGPVKAGRGAAYGREHVARLARIKALQAEGQTLAAIGRALDDRPVAAPVSAWWHHEIAGDVTVSVRADVSPWRARQVRAAIDELTRVLRDSNEENE